MDIVSISKWDHNQINATGPQWWSVNMHKSHIHQWWWKFVTAFWKLDQLAMPRVETGGSENEEESKQRC